MADFESISGMIKSLLVLLILLFVLFVIASNFSSIARASIDVIGEFFGYD